MKNKDFTVPILERSLLYELAVAVMFAAPLLISLCCYTLNARVYFNSAAGGITLLGSAFCFFIALLHFVRYKHRAFPGFSLWIGLLLLLMLVRLFYDTVIYQHKLFTTAGNLNLWLEFGGRLLIPAFFFALVIPNICQHRLFRLFGIFLGLECTLSIVLYLLSQWRVLHFNNMILSVNGITVSQAGVIFTIFLLWAWQNERVKTWLFLLLCPLGGLTVFCTGKRGPLIAFALTLAVFLIFSRFTKKKGAFLILMYVIIVLVVSYVTFGQLLNKRMDIIGKELALLKDVPVQLVYKEQMDADIAAHSSDTEGDNDPFISGSLSAEDTSSAADMPRMTFAGDIFNMPFAGDMFNMPLAMDMPHMLHVTPEEHIMTNGTPAHDDFVTPGTADNTPDNSGTPPQRRTSLSVKESILQHLYRMKDKAKDLRSQLWIAGFIQTVESPLWGNPLTVKIHIKKDIYYSTYVHNSVLESFMVFGVFGGTLFLFIIYRGFCDSLAVIRNKPELGVFVILFVFYFFQSIVSYSLYTNVRMWFALLAITAAANVYRLQCREHDLNTKLSEENQR